MAELPSYDELPEAPEGGRSGWGLFGTDDNVGLFNLLTPERVVAAARLIRTGARFPLDAPIDAFTPPLAPGRGAPRHQLVHEPGSIMFDDVYDNFFPQGSSQWDALGHVGYAPDAFYNGATEDDVTTGRRNTMEHWARHGVVGRGVVLDMVRTLAGAGRPYDPGTAVAFSVNDLELARAQAGIEFSPGDVVILHTGFGAWYAEQTPAVRKELPRQMAAPGLAQGEDMCRYLWDSHACAVVSDTYAVEVVPLASYDALGFLHRMLIGQFGMALGELWWTEDLAAHCAADGVYEVFFVSTPLNAPGAIGSPANAVAIK